MKELLTIFLMLLLLTPIVANFHTNESKEPIKKKPIQTSSYSSEKWKPIGKQRITCYCPSCNEPAGYESYSGKQLQYGHAACNWLPIGTVISIEGEIFEIVDTCGTDAIDIFIDTGTCECNINEYRKVSIKEQ